MIDLGIQQGRLSKMYPLTTLESGGLRSDELDRGCRYTSSSSLLSPKVITINLDE